MRYGKVLDVRTAGEMFKSENSVYCVSIYRTARLDACHLDVSHPVLDRDRGSIQRGAVRVRRSHQQNGFFSLSAHKG